ncbi:hypothetical protein ACRASX_01305 [Flavobacterium sp. TMP13]|uniref:hypothetical protein n=1 Tax=unclassified Flavobacterium TaxID=196869 RepID=UPI00076D0F38|nr:hypothetical protein [Flavobacterium sp. TAB 87]KVV14207.1 hypothetical protein AP058_02093 [Flavobacterium sp. TAB 87]
MKNAKLLVGIAFIGLAFTSCKDEKETQAEKKVDRYVSYVDSVKNVAEEDVKANWETVESQYDMRVSEAELALADLKDKTKAEERVNEAKAKYDTFKANLTPTAPVVTKKQVMRDNLFGAGNVGDDMSFAWVNAKNIHEVYQNFVHTVENNKDNYSREDWDEIKLMYEALDNRKNTVEKEGLSSEDNRKIAGLKVKFAPMYTINRTTAKSDENAEAKK